MSIAFIFARKDTLDNFQVPQPLDLLTHEEKVWQQGLAMLHCMCVHEH